MKEQFYLAESLQSDNVTIRVKICYAGVDWSKHASQRWIKMETKTRRTQEAMTSNSDHSRSSSHS